MHYVLKNDKANHLGAAPLQYGKVRIFQEDGHGGTAFIGEDWGKFTPLDDEMRLYVGVAQDIVVSRTIDKNEIDRIAGNLYDREVVVKFEIENFKDKAGHARRIAENVRAIRNEVVGDNGRDVQWELGKSTTLGTPDKEKSTFEQLLFHVPLPARAADGKAEKIVAKTPSGHEERVVIDRFAAVGGPADVFHFTDATRRDSLRLAHPTERSEPCCLRTILSVTACVGLCGPMGLGRRGRAARARWPRCRSAK